jgi:hypothetical protein
MGKAGTLAGMLGLGLALALACSGDEDGADGGSGGQSPSVGGVTASGGAPSSGGAPTTGGSGSGGMSSTGGRPSTTGRDGGLRDAPNDACPSGEWLGYYEPGCDGTVQPVCTSNADACSTRMCLCDGTTGGLCGYSDRPFAYFGECRDGGPDASDASGDGGD